MNLDLKMSTIGKAKLLKVCVHTLLNMAKNQQPPQLRRRCIDQRFDRWKKPCAEDHDTTGNIEGRTVVANLNSAGGNDLLVRLRRWKQIVAGES